MKIGLDFDNTIVCYDRLFHTVASEQGLLPDTVPARKTAVRDHLRATGREDIWTALQGEVYGPRMAEADPFPGLIDCLAWARDNGFELFIVSHKTKHPIIGPAHDLHEAARRWLAARLVQDAAALVPEDHVFFELTKAEKLRRIAACGCRLFLDDLPEILTAEGFPAAAEPLLFAPDGEDHPGLERIGSWNEFRERLESLCADRT